MTDKKKLDGNQEQEVDTARPEAEVEADDGAQTDPGTEAPAGLEDQLAEAQAQAAEYLDGWQRARAELANFKKRTERERSNWQSSLRGEVIVGLLPVLDDFDRAMENMPDDIEDHDWVAGIALIYRKFQTQLKEQGVEEIEALGKPFDPELHDAVMQRDDEDAESGTVVEVLRKGYKLGDKVIRPSLVIVAA